MKKEYDLKKLVKRPGKVKADSSAAKVAISIRLDGSVLAALKTEADRLGIPYQTYLGSVLHRYVHGELIDEKAANLVKILKRVS
jgi:predicted DNA binding CopG/RHH family protein